MKDQKLKLNILTVIACLVATFCVGVIYVWSVFKAPAIGYYSWAEGSVNLVSSIMLFCFTFGCLFGGILQDRIGPKKSATYGMIVFGIGIIASSFIPQDGSIVLFYVLYCLIAGLGTGFVYTCALNCLQKWMPDRLGLASGLASGAFALSTVVFSPVFSGLLEKLSMPRTLLVMGIVLGGVGLIACILIKRPSDEYTALKTPKKNNLSFSGKSLNLNEAVKTLPFWILFACEFFYNASWNVLTPLVKGLGIDRGLPVAVAVLCLSLTGVFNACGRLSMSALSDKIGRIYTMFILCGITLVFAVGLGFLQGGGYIVAVLFTAFAFGGPAAVFPAICTDIFGPKYSGRNYGLQICGLGFSSVAFNALSNALYKATGSYSMSFYMAAVSTVICIVLLIWLTKVMKKARA